MKSIFEVGDTKSFSKVVLPTETASFESGEVHPVYATFALGKDAEWVCRLFVLEMKEEHEEGIGTFLSIEHKTPALIGQKVDFIATLVYVEKNQVHCAFEARVGDRLIAKGEQTQKIIDKQKLNSLFASL